MTRYRKELPSLDYLEECFSLNKEGELIWKDRPSYHFSTNRQKACADRLTGSKAGSLQSNGYMAVSLNNKLYMVHRIVFKMFHDTEPGDVLDHIDQDKTNNHPINLREVNRQVNKSRSTKVYNKNGYRGVYKRKDRSKYECRITNTTRKDLRRDISVGYYDSAEEAAQAYNLAIDLLFTNDMEFYKNIIDKDVSYVKLSESFIKRYGGVPLLV